MIIRDFMGEVLATLQSSKCNIIEPVVVEFGVVLRALVLLKRWGGISWNWIGTRCVTRGVSIKKL